MLKTTTTSWALRSRQQAIEDVRHVWLVKGRLACGRNRCHHRFRVEPVFLRELVQTRDLRDKNAVRQLERSGKLLLENRAARRVRARLKNGPEPMSRDNDAARPSGFADRGRDDARNRR